MMVVVLHVLFACTLRTWFFLAQVLALGTGNSAQGSFLDRGPFAEAQANVPPAQLPPFTNPPSHALRRRQASPCLASCRRYGCIVWPLCSSLQTPATDQDPGVHPLRQAARRAVARSKNGTADRGAKNNRDRNSMEFYGMG